MKSLVPRRAMFVLLASLALILASAASASAAITASTITSPAQQSVFYYDDIAPVPTFSVSGTTEGDGNVDIRCYQGTNTRSLASNVPVVGNAFSAAGISVDDLTSGPCIMRAIPTGVVPADKSPFGGPVVAMSYADSNTDSHGVIYDYYAFGGQFTGSFDYDSLGGCGVDDSYLYNPATFAYSTQFYCNQWIASSNSANTATGIQVGGENAYTPTAARNEGLTDSVGFPAVTYSVASNPVTGDLTIAESEPIVKCENNVYPASFATCPVLLP